MFSKEAIFEMYADIFVFTEGCITLRIHVAG